MRRKVCRAVKDAAPSRVEFQVLYGVDGIPTAEHVMPLQHLMQHDATEETAQSEAEEYACRNRKMAACGSDVHGHRTANVPPKESFLLSHVAQQRLAAAAYCVLRPREIGRASGLFEPQPKPRRGVSMCARRSQARAGGQSPDTI